MSHPYQHRPEAATHTWLTPPEILRPLGEFDLDPCAHPGWETARRHICLPEDGLAAKWTGRVWLNPPYGRHTAEWLKRMAEHGYGTALVFARTETAMFQSHVWPHASALLFLARRPHFHRPCGARASGNSGGPMCLIAYGNEDAGRLRSAAMNGLHGALVTNVEVAA